MNEPNLADALGPILKPIVKEAVREAMASNVKATAQSPTEKSFLTIKKATEVSGLGVSDDPATSASGSCARNRRAGVCWLGEATLKSF